MNFNSEQHTSAERTAYEAEAFAEAEDEAADRTAFPNAYLTDEEVGDLVSAHIQEFEDRAQASVDAWYEMREQVA